MQDLIGYDQIVENSMRVVIYEVLQKVAINGLPGKHYFLIGFLTKFPGVKIAKHLLEKYPEEMTIAIQFQFKSMLVEPDHFRIILFFAGAPELLLIPYKAITSFSDPSINFSLKFNAEYTEDELSDLEKLDSANSQPTNNLSEQSPISGSSNIISFSDFRDKPKKT
jgi:hypothetical protein